MVQEKNHYRQQPQEKKSCGCCAFHGTGFEQKSPRNKVIFLATKQHK
jgi:hypothetical protein